MKFSKQRTVNRVVLIDVDRIVRSPYQPRRQFEPRAMQELADSIAQNGLLQPVMVRPVGSGYELVAGERRLMACRMNGLDKIPAIIEQFDNEKSAVFGLIENLQRKDLNYFEEAQGIRRLMELYDMTQQQVAKRLGKAQSTIANKLRLLNFNEDLRRRMLDAGLTERHARALLKLENDQQVQAALETIMRERLNVGETERLIETMLSPAPAPVKPEQKATKLFVLKDFRIFMNTITKAVSTMKLAGIDINTEKFEDEEFINYTMRIPKKSAYRPHSA
ncbi:MULTISPECIES: ParB/RepB/Spo0J family partition protein [Anaerotruncus]|uniref:ParB/RepB/Spo0J family partition protein n=1 Tax=Anaerotruncus colihominis TaxID=169435 RepID=A0A845T133_9FIRM|nr:MULTISPECIES: ParB/RepB/Spo0J family partition protein [Anaerotruncus]MCI8491955.1 ParB/RepB/Spo0J family partition protein [Anaerotruncus sp.]MCR2026429.1 ParB/RepB/Spo0J family partition protein [Anaerotruncus colihominis]NBI79720.1 ParB/RepB/Spo0J family partition protein [Anaerotruncus colihominis]NDO40584.1 ParB/RepB/Spo0J family partition protein [Anaerotruncus colihominis]